METTVLQGQRRRLARRVVALVAALFAVLLAAAMAACSGEAGVGGSDDDTGRRPARDLGDAPDGDAGEDAADDAATDAPDGALDAPRDETGVDGGDTSEDGAPDAPADGDAAGSDALGDSDRGSDAADTADTLDVGDATGDLADGADLADIGDATDAGDAMDGDAGLPTPPRGSYQYDRAEIGGLQHAVAVAFAPNEPFALILEGRDGVHRWDYGAGVDVELSPAPAGHHVDWHDVAFAPDGSLALLVGSEATDSGSVGVIYAFDPASWPAEGTPAAGDVFSQYADLPVANAYSALIWSDGEDPMVVSFNDLGGGNYTVALRRFDPEAGTMTFYGAQAAQGACTDLAPAPNAFGNRGWLLACNLSVLYVSEVGGELEWRTDLGGFNTGNVAHLAAHPTGGYALVVGWSGRRVFQFDHEVMTHSADAPWFTTRDIWGVRFQPDGRRALVFGGQMSLTGGTIGTVLEYRHPLYAVAEFTDVSIPNFGSPPFVAANDFNFLDAAWREDCDGGVLVGGKTNVPTDTGMVVTFEVEGGAPCW